MKMNSELKKIGNDSVEKREFFFEWAHQHETYTIITG